MEDMKAVMGPLLPGKEFSLSSINSPSLSSQRQDSHHHQQNQNQNQSQTPSHPANAHPQQQKTQEPKQNADVPPPQPLVSPPSSLKNVLESPPTASPQITTTPPPNSVTPIPQNYDPSKCFGVPLSVLWQKEGTVPENIVDIFAYLAEFGPSEEGIFRMPGSKLQTEKMRENLDQGIPMGGGSGVVSDTASVADLLLLWFQKMPGPLCTFELYPFIFTLFFVLVLIVILNVI
eukprot:TRINITY_DN1913_c0_g2_i1.p1 TRINITY_DN1913_c0_g2~~TRINITY_DN1913_c0_g2_i1.p1  ORF type:complete len:232 (+),score=47.52 TRINITY_DN1913_c0_g2_i1:256-951(+)